MKRIKAILLSLSIIALLISGCSAKEPVSTKEAEEKIIPGFPVYYHDINTVNLYGIRNRYQGRVGWEATDDETKEVAEMLENIKNYEMLAKVSDGEHRPPPDCAIRVTLKNGDSFSILPIGGEDDPSIQIGMEDKKEKFFTALYTLRDYEVFRYLEKLAGPSPKVITEYDIRAMAFDQLYVRYKESIGDCADGKVSKVILKETMGEISDKSYIGKEVYLIEFPVKNGGTQNSVIVYLNLDTYRLIGYIYTD